eukprot:scaffold207202_cov36-Tisochrysis_lutea.AAC.2
MCRGAWRVRSSIFHHYSGLKTRLPAPLRVILVRLQLIIVDACKHGYNVRMRSRSTGTHEAPPPSLGSRPRMKRLHWHCHSPSGRIGAVLRLVLVRKDVRIEGELDGILVDDADGAKALGCGHDDVEGVLVSR